MTDDAVCPKPPKTPYTYLDRSASRVLWEYESISATNHCMSTSTRSHIFWDLTLKSSAHTSVHFPPNFRLRIRNEQVSWAITFQFISLTNPPCIPQCPLIQIECQVTGTSLYFKIYIFLWTPVVWGESSVMCTYIYIFGERRCLRLCRHVSRFCANGCKTVDKGRTCVILVCHHVQHETFLCMLCFYQS